MKSTCQNFWRAAQFNASALTPAALLKAIDLTINKQKQLNGILYAGNASERLTWKAYGVRYSDFINKIGKK